MARDRIYSEMNSFQAWKDEKDRVERERFEAWKKNRPPPERPADYDELSTTERFLGGVGTSMYNVADTMRGWLPEDNSLHITPEQKQARQDKYTPYLDNTPGKLGQVAGNIGMTIAPGVGLGSMVGRGLAALPGLGRYLGGAAVQGGVRGGTEAAVAAGMTGANTQDEFERSALGGAAIGAGIPLVGSTYNRIAQPFRKSAAAQQLEREALNQGVDLQLTPGQAAGEGNLLHGIEGAFDRTPFTSHLLRSREGAVGNWNQSELRAALPRDLAPGVTTSGTVGQRQASDALGGAYNNALSGMPPLTPTTSAMNDLTQLEQRIVDRVRGEGQQKLTTTLDNYFDDLMNGRIDGSNVKEYERRFREMAETAGRRGDIEEAEAYRTLRNIVRTQRDEALGPTQAARMQELDQSMSRLAPLQEAGGLKGSVETGPEGFFTPSQLMTGGMKRQSRTGKATGRNPAIGRAQTANEVFGSTLPRVGPGTAEKMLAAGAVGGLAGYAAGAPMDAGAAAPIATGLMGALYGRFTPQMHRGLFGETVGQQAMRNPLIQGAVNDVTQRAAPWMRPFLTSGYGSQER